MSNPTSGLPATIDTIISTSLSDYRRQMIDNFFNGIREESL